MVYPTLETFEVNIAHWPFAFTWFDEPISLVLWKPKFILSQTNFTSRFCMSIHLFWFLIFALSNILISGIFIVIHFLNLVKSIYLRRGFWFLILDWVQLQRVNFMLIWWVSLSSHECPLIFLWQKAFWCVLSFILSNWWLRWY